MELKVVSTIEACELTGLTLDQMVKRVGKKSILEEQVVWTLSTFNVAKVTEIIAGAVNVAPNLINSLSQEGGRIMNRFFGISNKDV